MTQRAKTFTGSADMDAMVPLAQRAVSAIHNRDDTAIHQCITDAARHTDGLHNLICTLAAMVPDDETPRQMLAWMRVPATYERLRANGLSRVDAVNTARMVQGWVPVFDVVERDAVDFDEVAVTRCFYGKIDPSRLTRDERTEVVRRGLAYELSRAEIAERTGISIRRIDRIIAKINASSTKAA